MDKNHVCGAWCGLGVHVERTDDGRLVGQVAGKDNPVDEVAAFQARTMAPDTGPLLATEAPCEHGPWRDLPGFFVNGRECLKCGWREHTGPGPGLR